jgi:hypothetical protein
LPSPYTTPSTSVSPVATVCTQSRALQSGSQGGSSWVVSNSETIGTSADNNVNPLVSLRWRCSVLTLSKNCSDLLRSNDDTLVRYQGFTFLGHHSTAKAAHPSRALSKQQVTGSVFGFLPRYSEIHALRRRETSSFQHQNLSYGQGRRYQRQNKTGSSGSGTRFPLALRRTLFRRWLRARCLVQFPL